MSEQGGLQPAIPKLLCLYTETSVHPGTGQTTGAVDLPIQRERHTDFPVIPATGLKGSLRELAERKWGGNSGTSKGVVAALFGPEIEGGAALYAGAIAFGEAKLLAFPVRSLTRVFVWVTCPLVLQRLAREVQMLGGSVGIPVPVPDGRDVAVAVTDSNLGEQLVLEDLSFRVDEQDDWSAMVKWLSKNFLPADQAYVSVKAKFESDCVLISDDDFKYLVRHTTQIAARVALTEKKTTSDGGNLWYEETLPRDCLFYAWLRCERSRDDKVRLSPAEVARHIGELLANSSYVQLGGNETVGQGWCAVTIRDVPHGGDQ